MQQFSENFGKRQSSARSLPVTGNAHGEIKNWFMVSVRPSNCDARGRLPSTREVQESHEAIAWLLEHLM